MGNVDTAAVKPIKKQWKEKAFPANFALTGSGVSRRAGI